MAKPTPFSIDIAPDYEGLLRCIRRQGRPERVHHIELFLDEEVLKEIARRYDLMASVSAGDPNRDLIRRAKVCAFLGYDSVRCGVEGFDMPITSHMAPDTASLVRPNGRWFVDNQVGPISSWESFEKYPWPDPRAFTTRNLEWLSANLPDGMCISGSFGDFCERLTWLMGYETLCFALFEQRDLVKAIADRLLELNRAAARLMLQFDRLRILWASDDMGFRTGTLISPDDLREFVLPSHREMAEMSHRAGRPYLLHSCGQLETIMDDLIDDVNIDARHSFEDAIEPVESQYSRYASRMALLGGLDVDFLCRRDEGQIRARVRNILDTCNYGGYCLGSGNSIANYIPVDNYLAMLDEGRRYGR